MLAIIVTKKDCRAQSYVRLIPSPVDVTYRRSLSNPEPDLPVDAVGVVNISLQDNVTVSLIELPIHSCHSKHKLECN